MSLLAVVGAGCVAAAGAMAPVVTGGTKAWIYNPFYSDEFSGSSLDTSKWKQSIGDWRGKCFPAQFNHGGFFPGLRYKGSALANHSSPRCVYQLYVRPCVPVLSSSRNPFSGWVHKTVKKRSKFAGKLYTKELMTY